MTHHKSMTDSDFDQAQKLVTVILRTGYAITVNDGEDIVIRNSTMAPAILEAMGSTGADWLSVVTRDPAHIRVGSIHLVYGNEPGVLIADHSTQDEIFQMVARAEGDLSFPDGETIYGDLPG